MGAAVVIAALETLGVEASKAGAAACDREDDAWPLLRSKS